MSNQDRPLPSGHFGMETPELHTVIAISDGAVAIPALAAVQVISAVLEKQQTILSPGDLNQALNLSPESCLLLPESHLRTYLPILRLRGYSGAVIVLSSQPFTELIQRYPILRSQIGTHAAWGSPWQIATLFELVQTLVPLELSNLEDLQSTLKLVAAQRDQLLETVLFPCLLQLQHPHEDFLATLQRLDDTFNELLAQTPDARHTTLYLNGYRANISSHFRQLIDTVQRSQICTAEQVDDIKTILEKWREEVRCTGEGLDRWKI